MPHPVLPVRNKEPLSHHVVTPERSCLLRDSRRDTRKSVDAAIYSKRKNPPGTDPQLQTDNVRRISFRTYSVQATLGNCRPDIIRPTLASGRASPVCSRLGRQRQIDAMRVLQTVKIYV